MANSFFRFKQFTIRQDACAMKVCTDACLFGAWCAQELTTIPEVKTALDIGTGTGLLALMLAQKHKVTIDAVEIDGDAARQAEQNGAASPWADRITVHAGDVLGMGFLKSYDCIISNPPFYENDLQSPDSKRNTAHHSGRLSLSQLFRFIVAHLDLDGCFFLLLPYKRRDEAKSLLLQHKLFIHKEAAVHQTEQHAPFRLMLKGGFQKKIAEKNSIAIAAASRQYTTAFMELLQDYYLYL